MWFLEWLLSIIIFPITWFWNSYKRLKETRDVKRLIIFFILSLSGFAILAGALLWLILWLITFHIEVIVIISVVCWLFAYVKAKIDKPSEEEPTISQELMELEEQAIKAYPTMRNIIYQTLKICAENIGGIVPRVLADIEVLESHYIISQNICFYQFRLEKTDIRSRYQKEEIAEFISIIQAEINRKIQNKDFPTLAMEKFIDSYGNMYDAVYIDIIEDMDRYFLIQSVFYSPQYAEYLRQKKMVQQESNRVSNIPDAKWKS